jgi:hypothetical protein
MSPRDMPSKNAPHATTVPVDVEPGYPDHITPSASSSLTPEEPRSKAATLIPRRSLDIEEHVPRQRASHASRTWARLDTTLPAPVIRYSRAAVNWIKGPEPPRAHRINPLFERLQTFPARQLARLPRWARACVWIVGFVIWAVLFAVILTNYSLPSNIAGFGAPVTLSCVTNLWYGIRPTRRPVACQNINTPPGPAPNRADSMAATVSPLPIPRLPSIARPTASAPRSSTREPLATHL